MTFLMATSFDTVLDNAVRLKQTMPYNIYIFDCSEYYNDDAIVAKCNLINNKKGTVMADFLNEHTRSQCNDVCRVVGDTNLIFILNINTFEESHKNCLSLLNSIMSSKNDDIHYFIHSVDNYPELFTTTLSYNDKEFKLSPISTTIKQFQSYKAFTKYKKCIFPLNKLKINRKSIEYHLDQILFISPPISSRPIKTLFNKQDYKDIIVDYLTSQSNNYSLFNSISHSENIPLILYENIRVVLESNRTRLLPSDDIQRTIYKRVRQACILYYSYNNDPDTALFNNTNIYYFLYSYKLLLNEYGIIPDRAELNQLCFTKYYSNRAAEIQYQKNIKSLSIMD